MIKVLFIVRSTLYTVKGGDTVQVTETAAQLRKMGVAVDVRLACEKIDYRCYDLLHFFNLTRPADMLVHIRRSGKPYVLSPILVDYLEYDRLHRPGWAGKLFRVVPPQQLEYVKTIYRAVKGADRLPSIAYLWKGQQKSIIEILRSAACVFVNAKEEYEAIVRQYKVKPPNYLVRNGIDTGLFTTGGDTPGEEKLVLSVARIEGIKNQYNLIRALNDTGYKLLLIGNPAPNQYRYYKACRKIASRNITFIDHLPQQQLLQYYAAAKVHVLPSWFEVCGLSSLEAAAMGCNIVVTDKGYVRSYFGDDAFYCNPGDERSIYEAVDRAANAAPNNSLKKRIAAEYSWQQAAAGILSVYQKIIS